jgi:toxin-antitoxin system PIN domain toxin
MRCVDVNVLVHAHRADSAAHALCARWLDAARRADEPLGVPTLTLSGFLRIVTHPRVFKEPTPLDQALSFVEIVRAAPNHVAMEPGPRHWSVFGRLCRSADVRGNFVADAYLAAMAIERGAVMITIDRGFARFARLRWRHPGDDAVDVTE